MIDALKRVLGLGGKRSLDAASVGRRLQSAGRIANLNTDLFHGAATIRQRAAHMARNNPWVSAGVAALVGSTVGTGIVPTPRYPDPVVRDALSAAWLRWTDVADISGRQDFQGLQALVARSIFEAGEAFVRLRVLPEGLRLELVPADMVPASTELAPYQRTPTTLPKTSAMAKPVRKDRALIAARAAS